MIVFFLNRLKRGVSPQDYENWVRVSDYELTKKMKSVDYYRVNRVSRLIRGEKTYDYIESISINDLDKYEKELGGPVGKKILSEWTRFVEHSDAMVCDTIEPTNQS